jgi:maltose/moltooligosaccharide transporter
MPNAGSDLARPAAHGERRPNSAPGTRLTLWQIICMNFGFFGIQYSFGLQQANMSPIYRYLGAEEANIPWLWLAGPITGLLVQPIVGAMSDRTVSRYGRRTPYFLIGAIVCSLGLLAMPFSPTLWFAASLLWILDAANNVTMEPYRAYVSDRLTSDQRANGFLVQSAFTGLGQALAYLSPTIFLLLGISADATTKNNIPHLTVAAFLVGAVFSIVSIAVSFKVVPEPASTPSERERVANLPKGASALVEEIVDAVKSMPKVMRQLAWMKLFQWYALFCYWQFIVLSLARTFFNSSDDASVRQASLINGEIGAFYNAIAFLAAFALMPLARRFGPQRTHAVCLVLAGIAMFCLPYVEQRSLLFIPMLGVGLAWASIMGNPYAMLASSIPPERTGIYMGLFNVFIVLPMLLQVLTLPFYYGPLLGHDPRNVIHLAGVLMLFAAVACMMISLPSQTAQSAVDDLTSTLDTRS